jgi:mycobactin peptide synthetase MbtE
MDMDKTLIYKVFERKARQFAGRLAVEDPDRQLTYGELDQQVNQLEAELAELHIGRVVMTLIDPDARLIMAILAILKAGGIYLPADPSFPEKLMQQLLEEGLPDILITTPALLNVAKALLEAHPNAVAYLIVLNPDLSFYHIRLKELPENTKQPLPEDGCYIFYTSGSTGKAKAILGSQRGLSHFVHWEIAEFGLDESCRVSQLSQFTFDASLRDIFVPLCTGGTLCLPSAGIRSNIPLLLEWLTAAEINLVHCAPSVFRLITRYLETSLLRKITPLLPSLKYVLMAGEPLYGKDIAAWRSRVGHHVELVNLYGTSETTMAKTFHRIGETPKDPARAIHAGKPISNTVIAIFNGNKLSSPGEIGEIYIKTPFRSNGYLRNEALTKSVFVQNPLVADRVDIMHKTGDMGRYGEDGNIEVHGRLDDQVKINGIRLELGQVKQAVLSLKDIRDAVIVVVTNEFDENEQLCYYVSDLEQEEQLRVCLASHLSQNLIPSCFIRMESLPLTINGKVDKKALPRPQFHPVTAEPADEGTDEVLLTMKRIWKEVLGISEVSRNTAFFRSGGTSLRAIMVISRLYLEFGVMIRIGDIFEHPTLELLCDYIRTQQRKAFESIQLAPRSDTYETTYAQKGIWLRLQYAGGLSSFNMTGAYHFDGAVHVNAFYDTIGFLVERYEILRTSFVMDKGQLRQCVHAFKKEALNIQTDDYSSQGLPVDCAYLAESESEHIFDPLSETLIRFRIVKLNADHHCIIVTQHHLIADGWSVEILMKEFLLVLAAFRKNAIPQLPSLAIQYKDYAAWHNRYINSMQAKAHQLFWNAQLDGLLQPLDLVTGTARGRIKSYEGRLFTFDLPGAQAATAFSIGEEHGKSIFSVLLAITNILLYGYTGQGNIMLGSPFAGRNHPDLEYQLGLFVNILVLRNTIRPGQRFLEFLAEVADKAAAAYEHGIYPLEKTLGDLDPAGNGPGMRFLNVFVQMQDAHFASLLAYQEPLSGLRVTPVDFRHLTSKFDLTFNFIADRQTRRVSVAVEYDKALFQEDRLIRMRADMVTLIGLLATGTDHSVAELLAGLPKEENREIEGIRSRISTGISADY